MPVPRPTWMRSLLIAPLAVVLAGCASSSSHSTSSTPVQVSLSHCGQGWTHATAGPVTVPLVDTDTNAGEVYLETDQGAIVAEVDPMGPGETATLRASVGAGSYHLVCSINDSDPVTGPTIAVTGSAKGQTLPVQPVTAGELTPAAVTYQKWILGRLVGLRSQVAILSTDLSSGDLGKARRDWLTADTTYNTLGAAYDAFGDLGDAIDGDAHGLSGGTADPHWQGLERIEFGLWNGQSAATLTPLGRTLVGNVVALQSSFAATEEDPTDIVLRTHEITEDTLQVTLAGVDDYGAHAELAEASAQLSGTTELLSLVKPFLQPRDPQFAQIAPAITQAQSDIAAQHGVWSTTQLPPSNGHELVDSDISGLTELLAPEASMLEPRVATP